jgi:hypothetical protein
VTGSGHLGLRFAALKSRGADEPVNTPAQNPGFSTSEAKFARDTDSLLEGERFEPTTFR